MSIASDGFTRLSDVTDDPKDEDQFLVVVFVDEATLKYYKYYADKDKMGLPIYLSAILEINADNDMILNGDPNAPKPKGFLEVMR
jgi:hypothetical protein